MLRLSQEHPPRRHRRRETKVVGRVDDRVPDPSVEEPTPFAGPQGQAAAQVDRRDDLAAQVDQAAHFLRGQGHERHILLDQDLLHLQHVHPEIQAVHVEGAELICFAHIDSRLSLG